MLGLMQERELLVSDILAFAAKYHRGASILSVRGDGARVRHTYPDISARAARLANALRARGVREGERIGTLSWNDHRHLETYYAVPGIGAVCHTLNPRLFPDQIAFILRDAGDTHLFVDPMFLPLVESLVGRLPDMLRTIVVLADVVPPTMLPDAGLEVLAYEALLAGAAETIDWPRFDERSAALLCYTSGTVGDPKGVLCSHRSTLLHAMAVNLPDVFGLRAIDVALPVVPMFHVSAWGLPFCAPLVGASIVLPGPRLDGASLYALIEQEGVTQTAGVPTIWLNLLTYLRESRQTFSRPLRMVVGGSACPPALAQAFEDEHGATVCHAWGMTETSPLGTFNSPKPENAGWDAAARREHFKSQGRPVFGVEIKVVDDAGAEVPADGTSFGELLVTGPWVARAYFNRPGDPAFAEAGWLRTGDVATMDASGYIEIVDRAKDVIKSGGEWISTIALENIAVGCPGVREAAVIAARHPKWDERPLLLVVAEPGHAPNRDAVLAAFSGKVARWWVPDDVIFVDSLPHTATGKLLKSALKRQYGDALLAKVEDGDQVPQKVR